MGSGTILDTKCPAGVAPPTGLTHHLSERRFAMSERICSIPDCSGRVHARNWCKKHYSRWSAHGDPTTILVAEKGHRAACSVDTCGLPAAARGVCDKHYTRLVKYGDPLVTSVVPRGLTPQEYVAWYTDTEDPASCWIWRGPMSRHGYGKAWNGSTQVNAHRFAFEAFTGPVEAGMEVDHCCRNKACVNPQHMQVVTREENLRRRLLTPDAHLALLRR